MASTRVKVNRLKLVEAVKARKAEALAEYETQAALAEVEIATYEAEVRDALAAFLADPSPIDDRDDTSVSVGYWWGPGSVKHVQVEINTHIKTPRERPRKPDVEKYDRDIAVLEMSDEESVSLTADDYARYIK